MVAFFKMHDTRYVPLSTTNCICNIYVSLVAWAYGGRFPCKIEFPRQRTPGVCDSRPQAACPLPNIGILHLHHQLPTRQYGVVWFHLLHTRFVYWEVFGWVSAKAIYNYVCVQAFVPPSSLSRHFPGVCFPMQSRTRPRRHLLVYLIPLIVLSIVLNLPKAFEMRAVNIEIRVPFYHSAP